MNECKKNIVSATTCCPAFLPGDLHRPRRLWLVFKDWFHFILVGKGVLAPDLCVWVSLLRARA
jgi:hypothetical protein